jgi:hypothetical protein
MGQMLFFYSWIGPACFISSMIIQVLSRACFKPSIDGVFFLLFLISFFPFFRKIFKPLTCLSIYLALGLLDHFSEPLYFLAQSLSVIITMKGFKLFQNQMLEKKNAESLGVFFEKKLKEELDKNLELEASLETLILEPISDFTNEVNELKPLDEEAYDESLDLEEKLIAQKMHVEEKKPLKRLRRIAMKQTSFFDEP